MSASCCEARGAESGPITCPVCGTGGRPVDWLTVAALIGGPVPPRQSFRLCRTRGCEVVYFGQSGARVRVEDLGVVPGFKGSGGGTGAGDDGGDDSGLVCYCFQIRGEDIGAELRDGGGTDVIERVTAETKAGNCACEVRNPTGKCCLGDLRQTVAAMQRRMEVTT